MAFSLTWIPTALTHFSYGHQFLSFPTWSRFASVTDKRNVLYTITRFFNHPISSVTLNLLTTSFGIVPISPVVFPSTIEEMWKEYFNLVCCCITSVVWQWNSLNQLTWDVDISAWWVRPTVLLNQYFPLTFCFTVIFRYLCYLSWPLCKHFLTHAFIIFCIFSCTFVLQDTLQSWHTLYANLTLSKLLNFHQRSKRITLFTCVYI